VWVLQVEKNEDKKCEGDTVFVCMGVSVCVFVCVCVCVIVKDPLLPPLSAVISMLRK